MERASMKIGVQHQGRRNNQTDAKNVKKQLIKENISQKAIFNRNIMYDYSNRSPNCIC